MNCYAICHKKNWPIRSGDGARRMIQVFSTIEEAEQARQEVQEKTKSHGFFRIRAEDLIILKVSQI